MEKNNSAIAFKLLHKFIRDEFQKIKDEQDAISWKDMPSYRGCQIAIDVYDAIYKKSLFLSDKFNIDGYDLINEDDLND